MLESKYDVMNKKIDKFSNIMLSFTGSYALAFSQKKKYEVLEKYYNIILNESHILFEIKNDIIKYLEAKENTSEIDVTSLSHIKQISSELEKILVIDAILKDKYGKFVYDLIIDLISKRKSTDEVVNFVYNNLNEEEINLLKYINTDNFNIDELDQKYKYIILQRHQEFMNKNINPYISKKESSNIEFLKGIKIYEQNVNIDFKIKVDVFQKKLK